MLDLSDWLISVNSRQSQRKARRPKAVIKRRLSSSLWRCVTVMLVDATFGLLLEGRN